MAGTAKLRVIWNPGWFLGGMPVKFYLDDRLFHQGRFKEKVDVSLEVEPGAHELLAIIDGRPRFDVVKPAYYDLRLLAGRSYLAEIRYSRMMGRFAEELDLSESAG